MERLLKSIIAGVLSAIAIVFVENKLLADSFYPNGDVLDCEMAHTFGLSFSGISIIDVGYDQSKLSGVGSDWIVSHNIHSLANVWAGSLERYDNVATRVAVPPGAFVDFSTFYYNFSGHTVGILNSWLYLSDAQTESISDILDIAPSYRSIVVNWAGNIVQKNGMSVQIGALGNINSTSSSGVPKGKVIKSWKVKQPISYEILENSCNISTGNQIYRNVKLKVSNNGNNDENVAIFDQSQIIAPNSSFVFNVAATNFNKFVIENRSEITRCFGNMGVKGDDSRLKTHSFILSRNDYLHWTWGAVQTDISAVGNGAPYCVSRIPYAISVPLDTCNVLPKIIIESESNNFLIQPGIESKLNVKIINVGGEMPETSNVVIQIPVEWREYVSIKHEDSNHTADADGKIVIDGIKLEPFQSIEFPLIIQFPEVIKSNFLGNGEIIINYFGETRTSIIEVLKVFKETVNVILDNLCVEDGVFRGKFEIQTFGNTYNKLSDLNVSVNAVPSNLMYSVLTENGNFQIVNMSKVGFTVVTDTEASNNSFIVPFTVNTDQNIESLALTYNGRNVTSICLKNILPISNPSIILDNTITKILETTNSSSSSSTENVNVSIIPVIRKDFGPWDKVKDSETVDNSKLISLPNTSSNLQYILESIAKIFIALTLLVIIGKFRKSFLNIFNNFFRNINTK